MKYKKLIIFMPSIEGGGVEKNLFIVSNFLSTKLNKVSIISASKKYSKKFNNKIEFISPKNNIWDLFSRRVKYVVCLLILIKEILKNRNLIVFSFQANMYCILICKFFKITIISRSNSSPSGWSSNQIKNIIYRKVLSMADQIMVNSLEFKKELKKKFNIDSTCIYNPLNLKDIVHLSKKKIKKIYNQNSKLKIMNIGRFTDQKDHETLIRAINILKNKINFELIIIGGGQNEKKIKNLIKKLSLSNKIKIINFQKNPFPFLVQCNLFILSSRYEGLPNVLLESLSLKKFIISTKCPTGPSEILDNGKGGLLFNCGDYNQLANKILYFYKNKKICNSKLKFAYKRLTRFNLQNNLREYEKLVKTYL